MRTRRFIAIVGAVYVAAFSAAPSMAQTLIPESLLTSGLGSLLGAQINLNLGDANLDLGVENGLNISVPAGFVLRGASCPTGVDVRPNGTGVSLVVRGGADVGACVLQIVNVVGAAGAAVPAILQ